MWHLLHIQICERIHLIHCLRKQLLTTTKTAQFTIWARSDVKILVNIALQVPMFLCYCSLQYEVITTIGPCRNSTQQNYRYNLLTSTTSSLEDSNSRKYEQFDQKVTMIYLGVHS